MFYLEAVFNNSKLHLKEPLYLKQDAKVVVISKGKKKLITAIDLQKATDAFHTMEEQKNFSLQPLDFNKQSDSSEVDKILNKEMNETPLLSDSTLLDNDTDLEEYDTEVPYETLGKSSSLISVRQHERFYVLGTLTFDDDQKEYVLQDYSKTGLSFFSEKDIAIKTNLKAHFNLVGHTETLTFSLIVKRSIHKKDGFLLGCEFSPPLPADSPLLQSFDNVRL